MKYRDDGVLLDLDGTIVDVEAARRASIRTIAFRCGGWDDEHLSDALAIYDHPADLMECIDESPFAVAT
jgi:phosphoglycolate phosphatase-like HAD superfamily hydrolase